MDLEVRTKNFIGIIRFNAGSNPAQLLYAEVAQRQRQWTCEMIGIIKLVQPQYFAPKIHSVWVRIPFSAPEIWIKKGKNIMRENYLLYFVQGKISLEDCLKYYSKRLEEEIMNLAFEEISLKKKIEENN